MAYLSPDFEVINFITQDSAGNFSESSVVLSVDKYKPDESIFFFTHNGKRKFLVEMERLIEESKTVSDDSGNTTYDAPIIAVYDLEDFSAPLASADIYPGSIHSIAQLKDSLILECHKNNYTYYPQYSREEIDRVVEVNPETCATISSSDSYDVYSGNIAVHDNMIYVNSGTLLVMDKLGHITGRAESVSGTLVSSGSNLYIGMREYSIDRDTGSIYTNWMRIYRIKRDISGHEITSADFFSGYAEKVTEISGDNGNYDISEKMICADGAGGLYFLNTNRDICHWDGNTVKNVYTAG